MKKSVCFLASVMLALASTNARTQQGISDGVVKIGLIEDMSSLYADITGIGAVTAAKMAVEDFGGTVLGRPIEVVAAIIRTKRIAPPRRRGRGSTRSMLTRSWTSLLQQPHSRQSRLPRAVTR